MSKGGYIGGSTVIGFGGSFTGASANKLTHATDMDAHLTQKVARDAAREVLGKSRKKSVPLTSKAERRAENEARKSAREASKEVIVERKIKGQIVSTRIIHRS